MESTETVPDLASTIATLRMDVDRSRERAKSIAALITAASGALVAGLVFTGVGTSLTLFVKVTACTSLAFLLAGLAFYVSASTYAKKSATNRSGVENVDLEDSSDIAFIKSYEKTTGEYINVINFRIKLGNCSGLIAMLALLMAAISSLFPVEIKNQDALLVTVPPAAVAMCPDLLPMTAGQVSVDDIRGNNPLVAFRVADSSCGSFHGKDILIFVPKANVVVPQMGRHG